MNLGVAVVYLVPEGNEPLLELHLERIARHTSVPFTIHGVVNRPNPRLIAKLSGVPFVKLYDLPATTLRGPAEHARYLDRLLLEALRGGATHVATLHVDSFPVRDGWAETLADQLGEDRPFAAAVRDRALDFKPFPAGILARADFLEHHRPAMLLTPEELASSAYRRYRKTARHHPDSGVGWGFAAWKAGISWVPLLRSNRGEDHLHFGSIFADVFFHLGAAAWKRKDFPGSVAPTRLLQWRARLVPTVRRLLPYPVRQRLKATVARRIAALDVERTYRANEEAFQEVRARLLADPESYLRYLRFGDSRP